jgi:phosphoenolpyruvate carboxylase
MQAFSQALNEIGEKRLAEHLPWLGSEAPADLASERKLGQAYSISFQLLNIVEERTASRVRRLREKQHGAQAERGLWAEQIRRMQAAGLSQDQMLEVLRKVRVEPVLRPSARPLESGTGRFMIS